MSFARAAIMCLVPGLGAALLAGVAHAAPVAEDAAAWMGVKGATAELVDEPVFDGHLMLYRAGAKGGEAVVLAHGLGQNGARDWARVVPALAPKYEVFALDWPGFGLSDKGNQLYSPENYARVLEQAVAPRVGRPFVLVGHSMGAAVSLAYAAAHPQRLQRLVLADLAGVLHGSVYGESLARYGAGQLSGFPADAPWFDSLVRGLMTRIENMPVSREMVLRTPALRQKLLRGDPNLIAAFALGEHDFSDALRSVTVPTLLLWGSEDRVAPLRTAQLAAGLIPGARLELIAGAAHMPMLDDPDRFNALLLEELAGRARPAAVAPKSGPLEGRDQSCSGKSGARFSGDIPKLTLINCTAAHIGAARIGELRVLESDVTLLNSEVRDGIYALRSRVTLTGGSVAGAPALRIEESDVDAAGTRIDGGAVNGGKLPATLRLSVAEVRGKGKAKGRYVHDSVTLGPGEGW